MLTPWVAHVLFDASLLALYAPVFLLMGHFLFHCPLRWRRTPVLFLGMAGMRVLVLTLLPVHPVGYALSALAYMACCAFGLDLRGWRLLVGFLVVLLGGILMDVLTMHLFLPMCQGKVIYLADVPSPIPTLATNVFPQLALATALANSVVMGASALIGRLIVHRGPSGVHAMPRVACPALVSAVILLLVFQGLHQIDNTFKNLGPDGLGLIIRDQAQTLALLIVLVFYTIRDFRALRLLRQNKTLQEQQRVYDILLEDTRQFRHNVSNMIYGFEGALMSGDNLGAHEYYHQLARKCACINNENAMALGRVTDPAIASLLLQKIQAASSLEMPIYLSVQQGVLLKGLSSSDLCLVLGVLLDNAIEAAAQSASPHVSVEIARRSGIVEITIRNTYNERCANLSFLSGVAKSSKPGHEGLGLEGVRALLDRRGLAILNQIRRGRYIETLLLLGRSRGRRDWQGDNSSPRSITNQSS